MEDRAFGYASPSNWNALPNIVKCSTHFLLTFLRYLNKTFLLLVLLPQRARSTLLQLTRCTNYLLTYLLTYFSNVVANVINENFIRPPGTVVPGGLMF